MPLPISTLVYENFSELPRHIERETISLILKFIRHFKPLVGPRE